MWGSGLAEAGVHLGRCGDQDPPDTGSSRSPLLPRNPSSTAGITPTHTHTWACKRKTGHPRAWPVFVQPPRAPPRAHGRPRPRVGPHQPQPPWPCLSSPGPSLVPCLHWHMYVGGGGYVPRAKPPPSGWHQAMSSSAKLTAPCPRHLQFLQRAQPVPSLPWISWISCWWLPQSRPATCLSRSRREIPELERLGALPRLASRPCPRAQSPPGSPGTPARAPQLPAGIGHACPSTGLGTWEPSPGAGGDPTVPWGAGLCSP